MVPWELKKKYGQMNMLHSLVLGCLLCLSDFYHILKLTSSLNSLTKDYADMF